MNAVRTFLIGLGTAVGLGLASGVSAFHYGMAQVDAVKAELPDIAEPGSYQPDLKTRLYASDGTLLTEIYRENRELLRLEGMPHAMLDATVAAEDRRFWDHIGVSPRDIGRAAIINAQAGRAAQGASTITQQLVRDLYLSRRKQLRRKIAEALLALELERKYSKEEILELYLNQVNYGKGLYGVRTAAKQYFGKLPSQLTLGECAALAAIPQRPTANNFYADPAGAIDRRDVVLNLMCEQGYITQNQRDRAKLEPFAVRPYQPPDWRPRRAPYYTTWAVRELMDRLGEERVYAGGLEVICDLDLGLQQVTDQAVARAVRGAHGRGARTGAAILIDPATGAIKAMCGGLDWDRSQFNRATQARRQPGSAFKVFVYTAAIDRGYRSTDTVVDEPLSIKVSRTETWRPVNYDHRYRGTLTLEQALAGSVNIPAIKLIQRIGPNTVVSYAQRMGIRSELRPYPSLALGTSEVTLDELTAAYGVLPNGGQRTVPTTIREIRDIDGQVLYRRRREGVAVLSPRTAHTMVQMMRQVMISGTGKPAALDVLGGGKTGTTQNGRDAWFVGYTPHWVCGVWLGTDNNRPMYGVYGGTDCGPAWRTILKAAIAKDGGAGTFTVPNWINGADAKDSQRIGYDIEITTSTRTVEASICTDSGLLASPNCPHTVERKYEPGLEPTTRCPLHPATQPAAAPVATPQATTSTPDTPPDESPAAAPERPTARPAPEVRPAPAPAPSPLPAKPEPAPATVEPGPRREPKRVPENKPIPLLERYVICRDSGLLAEPGCPATVAREFGPGEAPTEECNLH